jgi:hypothetical protein
MKQRTTLILKSVLFLIIILILGFFIFLMPGVITGLSRVISVSPYLQYIGFIGLYGAVTPFLFGLYQTLKLFINIKKGKAFSELSLRSLKNIIYCASTISALYVISMPLIFLMADADDAPGAILFGLIVILVTSASAVFVSVFEKRCYKHN